MFNHRSHNRIAKVLALVAASLLLPILAYAKGSQGDQGGQGNPVVPEVNTAWVLIPVAGAAVLVSARQFARRKA